MNKVFLIGRLTRDPELRSVGTGVSVCRFSLAVDRPFKSGGDTTTDFFNIVVWRAQAENCAKYLTKGQQCAVVGRIENHSYDKDGEKRTATEIVADSVEFLSKAGGGGGNTDEFGKKQTVSDLPSVDDEDDGQLPF